MHSSAASNPLAHNAKDGRNERKWRKYMSPIKTMGFVISLLALAFVATSYQTTKAAQSQDDDTPWYQKPNHIKERSDALRDGLAAAMREDWEEANKRLTLAAGDYGMIRVWAAYIEPRAFFNLALVQDRMGGHELGAIGNYRAYLALKPNSKNAAALRKRIGKLLATARSNMQKLLKISEQSALEFPADSYERNSGLGDVAAAKAFLGDLPGAMAIVGRLSKYHVGDAYKKIGESLAKAGKFKEAKAAIRKIKKSEWIFTIISDWERIGVMEAEANEIEGAIATAEQIGSFAPRVKPGTNADYLLSNQISVYLVVIKKLIENEDFQRAKTLLSKTRQIFKGKTKIDKYDHHLAFIKHLVDLGEDAEAWRLANAIPPGIDKIRSIAFKTLGYKLVSIGKLGKARQALQEVTDSEDRKFLNASIEKIERYNKRLKEAKTAEQSDYIRAQLRDEGIRQPGPLRYKDTLVALKLIKFTPGQLDADDWASFGTLGGNSDATKDFKKFVRKLRGAPKFVLSTAMLGVMQMIEEFQKYRQIEERQRKHRQRADAG